MPFVQLVVSLQLSYVLRNAGHFRLVLIVRFGAQFIEHDAQNSNGIDQNPSLQNRRDLHAILQRQFELCLRIDGGEIEFLSDRPIPTCEK